MTTLFTDPQRLYDAIITNSLSVVKQYLQDGADPNQNLALAIPMLPSFPRRAEGDGWDIPKNVKMARLVGSHYIYPLHVALLNCLHSIVGRTSDDANGIELLNLLLQYGANPTLACCAFCVTNIPDWERKATPDQCSAVDFAVFLKAQYDSRAKNEHFQTFDKAIAALLAVTSHFDAPIKSVPQSTVESWKSMYLSKVLSDITFLCPDGATLPAHRCVLAHASSYFKAALTGEWKENDSDGIWKTSHGSDTLKHVLEFIYTGTISRAFVDEESLELLAISDEFGLDPLKVMAEQSLISLLTSDKVNHAVILKMLHASEAYSASLLKDACLTLVKRHAYSLMFDKSFMALAWEKPKLWEEIGTVLAPEQEQHDIRPSKPGQYSPKQEENGTRPNKRAKTGVLGWFFDRSE